VSAEFPYDSQRAPARPRLANPLTAWVFAAVVIAMTAAFGVVFLTPITPPAVVQGAGGAITAAFVLPFSSFAIVGGLIASRRPENPIGWLLLGGVGLLMIGALSSLFGSLLVHSHNGAAQWVALGGFTWSGGASVSTALFMLAILLFPNGRLRSRRWRWLVFAELALVALTAAIFLFGEAPGALGIGFSSDPSINATSPVAIPGSAGIANALIGPAQILQYLVEAAAVFSVFLRLKGADADRRHQIRWFASGATITTLVFAATSFINVSNPGPLFIAVFGTVTAVGALAVPTAIAVAVFKYRLYDIDIIISRTLVYVSLAAFITAVYVGIAVGIGAVVGSGGQPNLGLSILATIIVAAGFQPVRERLQKLANRLVYGKRATPYEVLSQFSGQVATTYAAEEVLPRMVRVLAEGTGSDSATVWLRSGEQLQPAATHPDTTVGYEPLAMRNGTLPQVPGATRSVPVRHQDDLLGALSIVKRRGDSLTPTENKLVDDLAQQAGLVLKNVGLTQELMQRLEELRASRQRVVGAQDEERRRLERNLHDGAQQNLIAFKEALRSVRELPQRDSSEAKATLQRLKAEADQALENLRDLARGIYPPLLADKGLVAALESRARKATVPVTVEASGIGRYTQDVEAAVYFCCSEAVQNAQKHSGARCVTVRLADSDGAVRFEVDDDGRGFDSHAVVRGSGLQNMADRIDALSGTVEITSSPGRGTTLRACVPVTVTAAA